MTKKTVPLCGACNNSAIGKGKLTPGKAVIRVCKNHKHLVVEFEKDD